MNPVFLIADIGGTNARFAISVFGETGLKYRETLQCKDYETIEAAIDSYLLEHELPSINGICFAAAGPIVNGSVKFTNNHWIIETNTLKTRFGTDQVALINDWEAIAYSLPKIEQQDLLSIGGTWTPSQSENMTLGALGPGSGLGVTGICVREAKYFPLITEGGHTSFAPENPYQLEILQILQSKFGRVSNERLLSGPGLVNIYQAVCAIDAVAGEDLTPAEIATLGVDAKDASAKKTLDLFFEILGQVAGDLALTMGATAGIYLGGGICQRYPDDLIKSRFRDGFENKGSHAQIMEAIPTWLISHKDPGLFGASVYVQTKMVSAEV